MELVRERVGGWRRELSSSEVLADQEAGKLGFRSVSGGQDTQK